MLRKSVRALLGNRGLPSPSIAGGPGGAGAGAAAASPLHTPGPKHKRLRLDDLGGASSPLGADSDGNFSVAAGEGGDPAATGSLRRKRSSKSRRREGGDDGEAEAMREVDKELMERRRAFPPATRPTTRFADVGGIDKCLEDIQELIEYPLTHPEVCVGVWVCGCVGVWVCGCVGVWVCGCVGVWVCGYVGVPMDGVKSIIP